MGRDAPKLVAQEFIPGRPFSFRGVNKKGREVISPPFSIRSNKAYEAVLDNSKTGLP
jgi:hypothetical protein